jgi:hypothetical protein
MILNFPVRFEVYKWLASDLRKWQAADLAKKANSNARSAA